MANFQTNQMVNFQGKEISLDDFMIMYDNFKNMMGKVSKKFLESIKVKNGEKITITLDESHYDDYTSLKFVTDLLRAKGEDQALRLLFHAWMVAKEDFCVYLDQLFEHSTIGGERGPKLFNIVMPFEGVDPMYYYDKDNKQIFKLLNDDLKSFKQGVLLKDSRNSSISLISHDDVVKKSFDLIEEYGDFEDDKDKHNKIWYYYDSWHNCTINDYAVIKLYRIVDLGENLYNRHFKIREAC